ncbi:MAG: helix-turn-helix domain-containing protein [Stackebrandtia sp.]
MLNRNDPLALKWLLGAQIAAIRHKSGYSLGQLAQDTGYTRAKLGTMETGRFGQKPEDVSTVLNACGAQQSDVERLKAMAERIGGRPWWQQWKDVLPEWFRLYVGLEGMATSSFSLELWSVPGILQTERYARAVTGATALVRPDHVERFAEFRKERAARIDDLSKPLSLRMVIAETTLRVFVGDVDTMIEQYDYLIEFAQRDNVTLQVLRPESGPYAVGAGRFTVLDFADALSVGYTELIDDASYEAEPAKVRSYRWATEQLERQAESPEQSIKIIRAMREKVLEGS